MNLIHGNLTGSGHQEAIEVIGKSELDAALIGLHFVGENSLVSDVQASLGVAQVPDASGGLLQAISSASTPEQLYAATSKIGEEVEDPEVVVAFYDEGYDALLRGLNAVAKLKRKDLRELKRQGLSEVKRQNVSRARSMLRDYHRKFGKSEFVVYETEEVSE